MTALERKILDAIETQNLAPRPYYLFLARRSVFWALAILSIALGAISMAVLMFAVSDYYATGWRLLDNMPLDELVLSLPELWVASMPLFVASAYFSLRQTRRGYRFPVVWVVAACLAASLGIGVVLHGLGAGQRVNEVLAAHLDWYRREAEVPFEFWSRPGEGFLGGKASLIASDGTLRLVDFDLNVWTVDIAGARIDLDQPILAEGDVALRGQVTGPMRFRADTVAAFD